MGTKSLKTNLFHRASLPHNSRWNHIYRCFEASHHEQYGFATFCFLCSDWVTSETEWLAHCQSHIHKQEIPFRCDPITFRHATACAGYCPVHLGRGDLAADKRMQQYPDQNAWRRHIFKCIPTYIQTRPDPTHLSCPHPDCPHSSTSRDELWHHLGDIHGLPSAPVDKRKSNVDLSDPPKRFKSMFQLDFDPSLGKVNQPMSDDEDAFLRTQQVHVVNPSGQESCAPTVGSLIAVSDPITPQLQNNIELSVSVPMGLIDPQLQSDTSSTKRVEISAEPDSQTPGCQSGSVTIDRDEVGWDVEAVLAKWEQGRQVQYLVKWKGFEDTDNSWVREHDMSDHLVKTFESEYKERGGNYHGVELCKKRTRRHKVEYLVRWKGRPDTERTWEKESVISRDAIDKFEGHNLA